MSTDWTQAYGAEGGAYPVQPGEVWAVGPHRIVCLDLEDEPRTEAWLHYLRQEGPCQVGFVDPPFNASLARSFRTKSTLDGDKGREVDFPRLLARIVVTLRHAVPDGPVWMEIGNGELDRALSALRQGGWTMSEHWPATYADKQPCNICRVTPDHTGPRGPLGDLGPAGQDDMMLPAFAIARDSKTGDRVFDPCCGRGLTATSAARLGRVFYGSELAPRRVSAALSRLADLTGYRPFVQCLLT